jgi:cbb3-type cytochrome oxidase subunit 3
MFLKSRFSIKMALYITLVFFIVAAGVVFYSYSKKSTSEITQSENFSLKNELLKIKNEFGEENIAVAINIDRLDFKDSLKLTFPKTELFCNRVTNNSNIIDFSKFIKTNRKYLFYFTSNIAELDGIDELIFEKFSHKISERKFTGGRICLFSKDSVDKMKPLYFIDQDFLNNKPFWELSQGLRYDTIVKFENRKSLVLDSLSPYSNAFSCNLDQIKASGNINKIVLKTDFFPYSLTNAAHLVVKYSTSNYERRDIYFNLNKFEIKENSWCHAVFELDMNLGHSKNDNLQIFVWDQGGKKMLVGNVQLIFY